MNIDIIMIYRKDTEQREINKNYVISYVNENIKYNKLIFQEYPEKVWHRTKYLNECIDKSTADVVILWDVDVMVNPLCVYEGYNWLMSDKKNVMFFPHGQVYGNINYNMVRDKAVKGLYDELFKGVPMSNLSPVQPSFGGVVMIKRVPYVNIRENENLVGWACDDFMRKLIVEKLGYKTSRTDLKYTLFHLDHVRTIDKELDKKGWDEYKKIEQMSQEECMHYVLSNYEVTK